MKLPALLCSDLHLTANPKDEYRWKFFKWLLDECVSESVKTLVILGDLTDDKDYHPASLTNRLVESLTMLTYIGVEIVILQGNHDYLRAGHSYFKFLSLIPGITFVTVPTQLDADDDGPLVYCLPHTKTPAKTWQGFDFSHYDYLFMHQTVSGAKASNGQVMAGEALPPLNAGKVYSGDIHVPQVIGQVEYVGSPYHVHFGDRFTPRCILLDRRNRPVDLHYETISRVSLRIESPKELHRIDWLKPGDQVKLVVTLPEADKADWRRIKADAIKQLERRKVDLCEVKLVVERSGAVRHRDAQGQARSSRLSDPDALWAYVEREDLGGEALDMGLEIMQ